MFDVNEKLDSFLKAPLKATLFEEMDIIERDIYALICSSDGIKAREIARKLKKDKGLINHYLYASPYMHELCYCDEGYNWHGYIRQRRPHRGLEDFCGYYSTVQEFLDVEENEWFEELKSVCMRIFQYINCFWVRHIFIFKF